MRSHDDKRTCLKIPGRVGDSPILGAGVYVDSRRGSSLNHSLTPDSLLDVLVVGAWREDSSCVDCCSHMLKNIILVVALMFPPFSASTTEPEFHDAAKLYGILLATPYALTLATEGVTDLWGRVSYSREEERYLLHLGLNAALTLINWAMTSHLSRETGASALVFFTGLQSFLWWHQNADGTSVIWSALAGVLLHDVSFITSFPLMLSAATVAYYAVTKPTITTIAHFSGVALGFVFGSGARFLR